MKPKARLYADLLDFTPGWSVFPGAVTVGDSKPNS